MHVKYYRESSMEREEGVVVRGRVEIDMRQPFRSVKEAVTLFGERVLAGEIYANKLKEIKAASENGEEHQSRVGAAAVELEVTKQSLEKAEQEGQFMAYCLTPLKQDLEQTKQELQQLKARKSNKQLVIIRDDPEIQDLKFIENATRVEGVKTQKEDVSLMLEYQRKRSVKFASSPLLAKLMVSRDVVTSPNNLKKKAKRKPTLMALVSGIFSKKKGNQEVESIREPPKAF